MHKITIRKQSLVDWSIELDGKHAGWIQKLKIGYQVQFKGHDYGYFHPDFKTAKALAGMAIEDEFTDGDAERGIPERFAKRYAQYAYTIADAMINARKAVQS